jgi:hypothetical protein
MIRKSRRRAYVRNATNLTRDAYLSAQAHEEYKAVHGASAQERNKARRSAEDFRAYRIARWGATVGDTEDERKGRYKDGRLIVDAGTQGTDQPEVETGDTST